MKRYDMIRLADFVRGTAAREIEQEIRGGLDSASARSRKDLELLRQVADVGRWDRDHEVPESALRIARAIGSLRPPQGAASSRSAPAFHRLPFEILFDSRWQPALAGTRSGAADARHLVAESADLTVDARLEPARRTSSGQSLRGSVAAQVLRRDDGRPVPDMPVLVLAGGEVVSSGTTNPTGDFQAADLPDGPVSLCLLVGRESCIEVPLSLA